MERVRRAWERIDRWLAANADPAPGFLRPPAAPDAVASAEAAMGVAFPAELRASLAVHDGEEEGSPSLFDEWVLLPAAAMAQSWRTLLRLHEAGELPPEPLDGMPAGPARPTWHSLRWVPLADDGGGNRLMLDLDPGEGGAAGQLIVFYADAPDRPLVAPSLAAWLERHADDLEAGRFRVERLRNGDFDRLRRVG